MHPWRLAADGSKGCTTRAGLAERMENMCGGLGEELSSCRSMFMLAKRFGSWCNEERRVERVCSMPRDVGAGCVACLAEIQIAVTYRCI